MKMNKTIAVISAVAVLGTAGATAFAVSGVKDKFFKGHPAMTDGERPERIELTDEQKAEKLAEMKEKLAQELADDKITQEKYDEMIAAMENGEMHGFGGMRGERLEFDGERPELTEEQKAEMEAKLGERPDFGGMRGERPEFDGERPERAELTDEQKAEMEAKMAERLAEMKEKLAQELADGKITQEQYDEMIAAMEDGKMPMGMGAKGPGRGGKGGMGGFGGRQGNAPSNSAEAIETNN